MTRKALRLTAAIVAAVFLWLVATLPPRPALATGAVAEPIRARTVAGAIHVHSKRSDGSGDRETIAAAAARAGLRFVVMTDHGDATRIPDRPEYVHGVLCIDAVEISTNGGHLIALDMPAAPYPLGGEAAAAVEDVIRLGGMPVAAHPDSVRRELAWKDGPAPIAGLEWLNLDSEWREESRPRLARVAFNSLVRPGPALATILNRPTATLARWDSIGAARALVGLAGHDAHGGLMQGAEGGGGWRIPGVASYEASFATFAVRVVVGEAMTGTADRDARLLLDAVRAGRVFTAIDAIAGPAWVDYHATVSTTERQMGETTPFEQGTALLFRSTIPSGGVAVLLRDGVDVAESGTGELKYSPTVPGAYRVEVRHPRWAVPWIITNPIYLRGPNQPVESPSSVSSTVLELRAAGVVEKDPASTINLESAGGTERAMFQLRAGERVSQYVAVAIPLPQSLPRFDQISFSGRSAQPMRVSVQVRFNQAGGARWVRSVYLSPEPRQITIPVASLLPADSPGSAQAPAFESASSLLFVVDLTNAAPGAEGQFEISSINLAATKPGS